MFNLSAEDLELFTFEPKLLARSTRAAVSINKALNKVPAIVGDLIAGGSEVTQAIHQTLLKVVRPVLNRNAKSGAADTEPETVITDIMEKHFGLRPYTLDRFEWV